MKTRAAILYKLNAPLVIEDVDVPALKSGQVLVRILYSGICRAQWNEIIGLKGPDRYLPHMLGHEGSAIVEDIGPSVTKVKRGDYVALSWIKSTGLDGLRSFYRKGRQIINAGAVTTFSDYSVVSENRVTRISRKIPADVASIIGCAVATGCGIVNNTLAVEPGRSIAVFGVGGVGLSVILGAKQRGCSQIIAVDIHKNKLALARKVGATHGVLSQEKNAIFKIRSLAGNGVDYAVDASGIKAAMEMAFDALHDQGTLVIAGNLSRDEKISLHPFELIKGKRIIGTWGGETLPQRDLPRYVQAFGRGQLPIEKLITHRFDLEDINKAFAVLKNGQAGRIILKNTDDNEF